jgi:hypothetical protein
MSEESADYPSPRRLLGISLSRPDNRKEIFNATHSLNPPEITAIYATSFFKALCNTGAWSRLRAHPEAA